MPVLYRVEAVVGVIGVTAVSLYACVLYERRMRYNYHKIYLDSVVKMFEICMRKRRTSVEERRS